MSAPSAEAPPDAAARTAQDARAADSAAEPKAASAPLLEQLESLYAAAGTLGISLKRFFGALAQLLLAESRIVRHGVPLFFIGTIALIALAVSLWTCTVALIGWALAMATHSVGIALALLVLGHIALIVGLWFALKRGVRHASFPQSRAELRALGHQLSREFDHASARPASSTETRA
ncbi:MAG: hypothetical protein JSS21_07865 [Proteobacteria bacterium]|nr:hypothetical protein [Pseudomonadota bacterium]